MTATPRRRGWPPRFGLSVTRNHPPRSSPGWRSRAVYRGAGAIPHPRGGRDIAIRGCMPGTTRSRDQPQPAASGWPSRGPPLSSEGPPRADRSRRGVDDKGSHGRRPGAPGARGPGRAPHRICPGICGLERRLPSRVIPSPPRTRPPHPARSMVKLRPRVSTRRHRAWWYQLGRGPSVSMWGGCGCGVGRGRVGVGGVGGG
jgi:hypothetical protein